MNMAILLIIVLFSAAAVFILIPALFPEKVFDFLISMMSRGAGLKLKEVKTGDHNVVYYDNEKEGEAVVLLHGLGGDKSNWLQFVKNISGYRFIIPDIPGFGNSSRIMSEKYDVKTQVRRLDEFLVKTGIDRFHIAGNSMGGNIAVVYYSMFPEKVKSIILMDALGVDTPEKSELEEEVLKGNNPLVVSTPEDYEKLMYALFTNKPKVPSFVRKVLVQRTVESSRFIEKVFGELLEDPEWINPYLKSIEIPVQIIWGDQDRLLHISAVGVLENGLKNHSTAVLKECGHVPQMERPEETASYVRGFLGKIS